MNDLSRPVSAWPRALASSALLLAGAAAAPAATYQVDVADPSCSDTTGTPFCTIQAAIDNAAGGDVIEIGAGLYLFGAVVDRDLTLRGSGISAVNGDCDGETNIAGGPPLTVQAGVQATVSGVTLFGSGAAQGGGVFNEGVLSLADSEVCGNFASTAGSGIYTSGQLVLQRVQVYDNWQLVMGTLGGGLHVDTGAVAFVDQSEFTNNHSTRGGGVSVAAGAWLLMTRSRLENNFADESSPSAITGEGGGVFNEGWAWLDQSEVGRTFGGGNVVLNSDGRGGGIYNSGTLLLTRSTVAGNAVDWVDPLGGPGLGAGLYNSGSASLISSTVSGNIIQPLLLGLGAGIFNVGNLSVSNGTISDNTNGGAGWSDGAGIHNDGAGLVDLRNTIVAHQAVGHDCDGTFLTEGHNIDTDGTCGLVAATDQSNVVSAGLLPLALNGGPTRTHALDDTSPAVDAGNPAGCLADWNADGVPDSSLTTDQRGSLFIDSPTVLPSPSTCDAGAYELDLVANGGFEEDGDGDLFPDEWTGVALTPTDRRYCSSNLANTGRCVAAMAGDAAVTKQLVHEIDRIGSAGDSYKLRLYGAGFSLTGTPRVVVQFDKVVGASEEFELLLNTGTYGYQEWTLDVVTTVATGYDVVRILIEPGDGGVLLVDDVGLVP